MYGILLTMYIMACSVLGYLCGCKPLDREERHYGMPQRVSSPHWLRRHIHLEVGPIVIANEVVVESGHVYMLTHQKALIDGVDVAE